MKKDSRENFLKIYANLPLGVRQEIILVLDEKGRTITWDSAFFEVKNDTELSKIILEKLDKLEII